MISASMPLEYIEDNKAHDLFEEVAGNIGFALRNLSIEEKRREALLEAQKRGEGLELALEGGDLGTWCWNIDSGLELDERGARMKGTPCPN